MTAAEVLHALTQTDGSGPGLLVVVVALLWQISASAKRGFGSIARLGKRIGQLEARADRAELRTWQLEQLLRAEDVAVPPWPRPRTPADDYADEDDDDQLATEEARRIPVPPLAPIPPHLTRSRTR